MTNILESVRIWLLDSGAASESGESRKVAQSEKINSTKNKWLFTK